MSFYFSIIGTKDNPLFEHEFGTSKQGGDGQSRFRDDARRMNPFIVHSALDILDDVQWASGAMYLKTIDRFANAHVSAFLTAANTKFMLLSAADLPTSASHASLSVAGPGATFGVATTRPGSARANAAFAAFNPTAPATEDAIKNFFLDVYDAWVKTVMNPFYAPNMPVLSPVFRQRVAAAAKKYL
jgi:trafficking protein particle complex subunit 2